MRKITPRAMSVQPLMSGSAAVRHRSRGARETALSELSACARVRLVGLGFRGWMHGLETGDLNHWAGVCRRFTATMGKPHASESLARLADWVTTLERTRARRITVAPPGCERLCRDECIAVAVIAAAQREPCPAMRACAYALVGSANIDPMISEAERFAAALGAAGVTVPLTTVGDPELAVSTKPCATKTPSVC